MYFVTLLEYFQKSQIFVHSCTPGQGCLTHAIVDYLIYGLKKVNPTIEDVPNVLIQEYNEISKFLCAQL